MGYSSIRRAQAPAQRRVPLSFALGLLVLSCGSSPASEPPRTNAESTQIRDFPGRGGGIDSLELCAPIRWRAHRDSLDPATCEPKATPEQLASEGGVFLLGSLWDVSDRRTEVPREPRCGGPYAQATNATFIEQVRDRRPENAPAIAFVHLHRFDLVPLTFAALEGFDADFLVRTTRPWNAVLNFFALDPSPTCRPNGCRWSDSYWGDPALDHGPRLRDWIDASSEPGAYQHVVYYMARSQPGRTVGWPRAALGDLSDPGYRAWRVAEARRALEVGGFDAVMLNEKLPQYRRRGGHWLGGSVAFDVEHLNAERRTLWTAPPDAYGYAEYLEGWADLGRELRAAGVPYAVRMSAKAFDPAMDPRIRETTLGARLVLVHTPLTLPTAQTLDREMSARGGRVVLMGRARASCPSRPAPPSQTPASLDLDSAPPAPLELDLVTVGAPGNPGDARRTRCCNHRVVDGRSSGFGAVAYPYDITRSEVTVDQWVALLNAVARSDAHGLWNDRMGGRAFPSITRSSEDGRYSYRAVVGQGATPIRFISWFDALRFVNWLHNGQPSGPQDSATTEDGAYPLLGQNPPQVQRSPHARFWISTEDEWYKAAYYDRESRRYLNFGYGDEPLPQGAAPDEAVEAHHANLCPPGASVAKPCPIMEGPGRPTPACAYPGRSPWGLCDVVGNAFEMMETRETWVESGETATVMRGGHFKRGWQDNASEGRNFILLDQADRCFACSFRITAPTAAP